MGSEREQLEELHAAVMSHRRPIPKSILNLYLERLGQTISREKRRDNYILARVFAGATLLLIIFLVWVSVRNHSPDLISPTELHTIRSGKSVGEWPCRSLNTFCDARGS